MSGCDSNRDRTSFIRQVLRFLRLSKARSDNDIKCSRIIEKNKNVERFKEEFPITGADYTQHRWRESQRHKRKTSRDEARDRNSAPAAEREPAAADPVTSCGCQIIKAFTHAKEVGDEETMKSIKEGTFVPTEPCEHALAPTHLGDSSAQKKSKNSKKCSSGSGAEREAQTEENSGSASDTRSQFKRRSSLRHSVKKRLNRLKRSATEQVLRQEYSALVVESDTEADVLEVT